MDCKIQPEPFGLRLLRNFYDEGITMTKQLKLTALVVALIASTGAMAHEKNGYTISQESREVVRNNYGECWKNSFFDKETHGLVECGDKEAEKEMVPVIREEEKVIKLQANFLFGFDKATLRPEAKQTLNQVAQEISESDVQSVRIEGHTDFMGSEKYNQALSEKRAKAVADYLIAQGVDAGKVAEVIGLGETQQQMQAQCEEEVKGIKNKAKRRTALIACIEPDRRVDVRLNKRVIERYEEMEQAQ